MELDPEKEFKKLILDKSLEAMSKAYELLGRGNVILEDIVHVFLDTFIVKGGDLDNLKKTCRDLNRRDNLQFDIEALAIYHIAALSHIFEAYQKGIKRMASAIEETKGEKANVGRQNKGSSQDPNRSA